MADHNDLPHTEMVGEDEADLACEKDHVEDIDSEAKIFLSTFSTIRSKLDDVARAESEIKRFELSLEAERKRLQKQLEAAKTGLRNARVQMGVELGKLDAAAFSKISQMLKEGNNA